MRIQISHGGYTMNLSLDYNNGFYEIVCDGEHTGMGSTDYEQAYAMMQDFGEIYPRGVAHD